MVKVVNLGIIVEQTGRLTAGLMFLLVGCNTAMEPSILNIWIRGLMTCCFFSYPA